MAVHVDSVTFSTKTQAIYQGDTATVGGYGSPYSIGASLSSPYAAIGQTRLNFSKNGDQFTLFRNTYSNVSSLPSNTSVRFSVSAITTVTDHASGTTATIDYSQCIFLHNSNVQVALYFDQKNSGGSGGGSGSGSGGGGWKPPQPQVYLGPVVIWPTFESNINMDPSVQVRNSSNADFDLTMPNTKPQIDFLRFGGRMGSISGQAGCIAYMGLYYYSNNIPTFSGFYNGNPYYPLNITNIQSSQWSQNNDFNFDQTFLYGYTPTSGAWIPLPSDFYQVTNVDRPMFGKTIKVWLLCQIQGNELFDQKAILQTLKIPSCVYVLDQRNPSLTNISQYSVNPTTKDITINFGKVCTNHSVYTKYNSYHLVKRDGEDEYSIIESSRSRDNAIFEFPFSTKYDKNASGKDLIQVIKYHPQTDDYGEYGKFGDTISFKVRICQCINDIESDYPGKSSTCSGCYAQTEQTIIRLGYSPAYARRNTTSLYWPRGRANVACSCSTGINNNSTIGRHVYFDFSPLCSPVKALWNNISYSNSDPPYPQFKYDLYVDQNHLKQQIHNVSYTMQRDKLDSNRKIIPLSLQISRDGDSFNSLPEYLTIKLYAKASLSQQNIVIAQCSSNDEKYKDQLYDNQYFYAYFKKGSDRYSQLKDPSNIVSLQGTGDTITHQYGNSKISDYNISQKTIPFSGEYTSKRQFVFCYKGRPFARIPMKSIYTSSYPAYQFSQFNGIPQYPPQDITVNYVVTYWNGDQNVGYAQYKNLNYLNKGIDKNNCDFFYYDGKKWLQTDAYFCKHAYQNQSQQQTSNASTWQPIDIYTFYQRR